MESNMSIKERIRAVRESKGISVAFVANKIGMLPTNYSRLERTSEDRIYFETVEAICQALDISICELLGQEVQNSSGTGVASIQELEQLRREKMELLESLEHTRLRFADQTLLVGVLPEYIAYIIEKEPSRLELAETTARFIADLADNPKFGRLVKSLSVFYDEKTILARLKQDLPGLGLNVLKKQ
jgi:transcriptional regulator with XRE-family HTH domain